MAKPEAPALPTQNSAGSSLTTLGNSKGTRSNYGQTVVRHMTVQNIVSCPEQFFHLGNSLIKPNAILLTYCFFLGQLKEGEGNYCYGYS